MIERRIRQLERFFGEQAVQQGHERQRVCMEIFTATEDAVDVCSEICQRASEIGIDWTGPRGVTAPEDQRLNELLDQQAYIYRRNFRAVCAGGLQPRGVLTEQRRPILDELYDEAMAEAWPELLGIEPIWRRSGYVPSEMITDDRELFDAQVAIAAATDGGSEAVRRLLALFEATFGTANYPATESEIRRHPELSAAFDRIIEHYRLNFERVFNGDLRPAVFERPGWRDTLSRLFDRLQDAGRPEVIGLTPWWRRT